MTNKSFSIIHRLQSFKYALNGLKLFIVEEHNARVHIVAGISAIILGFILRISITEWIAVTLSIGLVLTAEAANSVIERIADLISPAQNDKIKFIKDISAAAVLISAFTAFTIGCIVFIPHIFVSC